MNDHPLTNEMIEQILRDVADYWDHEKDPSTPMFYEVIRVATDKQLDKCVDWLEDTDCDDPQETAQRLRKAMRPQEGS